MRENTVRSKFEKYPEFSAEIEEIEKQGITDQLLNRIINKHLQNAACNKELIARYEALEDGVPIFHRQPRFESDQDKKNEFINHRINNDFFSEIVDFKTGYFAGNPISYSYSDTREALTDTGDAGDDAQEREAARDAASKALTDFVTRSNMFDVDMECTKYASICGYCGRLFYIDPEGNERVMVVPPNECIILSKSRDITHPTYGVRYYTVTDINDREIVRAEFYDDEGIYFAEGSLGALHITDMRPNLFGCCPLQGIPNNREMLGDAEKVLALIDAYDRAISDANNEIDAFANAYIIDLPDIPIYKAVGASGKNYPVKLPDGNHARLAPNTAITKVKVFAGRGTSTAIRKASILSALYRHYNIKPSEWPKVRGDAFIMVKGEKKHAEIHWFEADGMRVEMKVKRFFEDES